MTRVVVKKASNKEIIDLVVVLQLTTDQGQVTIGGAAIVQNSGTCIQQIRQAGRLMLRSFGEVWSCLICLKRLQVFS